MESNLLSLWRGKQWGTSKLYCITPQCGSTHTQTHKHQVEKGNKLQACSGATQPFNFNGWSVFLTLCLLFLLSVFLAAASGAGAKAARQALRRSHLPLYLCVISTSLLPSLPASCNSLLLYVCVSLSLSVSLITTHPEPLVFSWTGRDTETQEVGGGQKQKKFSLKYLITLFHAPSLLFLPVSVYLEVPVHNLGWMQVVESRNNLCAVEARALLWEHPFSGQMEKQLREKEEGREGKSGWEGENRERAGEREGGETAGTAQQ